MTTSVLHITLSYREGEVDSKMEGILPWSQCSSLLNGPQWSSPPDVLTSASLSLLDSLIKIKKVLVTLFLSLVLEVPVNMENMKGK